MIIIYHNIGQTEAEKMVFNTEIFQKKSFTLILFFTWFSFEQLFSY